MLEIPKIRGYKPLIFAVKDDSIDPSYESEYARVEDGLFVFDSREFGLIAKTNPYPIFPDAKEPYKNEWKELSGDEEYIAPDGLRFKPIEFSLGLYIKARRQPMSSLSASDIVKAQVRSFLTAITKCGTFKMYDGYTAIGFDSVRYVGFSLDSFVARDEWARAIYSIKLKVSDPTKYWEY